MGTKIAQAERNPKFIWGKKRSEEGGNLFPNLLRSLFTKRSLGDCRGAAYLNRAAHGGSLCGAKVKIVQAKQFSKDRAKLKIKN